MSSSPVTEPGRLPPTSESLRDDATRPYFLWWTDATVGQLKQHLASSDLEELAMEDLSHSGDRWPLGSEVLPRRGDGPHLAAGRSPFP
jgi:hypothetical protein